MQEKLHVRSACYNFIVTGCCHSSACYYFRIRYYPLYKGGPTDQQANREKELRAVSAAADCLSTHQPLLYNCSQRFICGTRTTQVKSWKLNTEPVLSLLLYTLLTYDCVPVRAFIASIIFTNTTVIDLVTNKFVNRKEVKLLLEQLNSQHQENKTFPVSRKPNKNKQQNKNKTKASLNDETVEMFHQLHISGDPHP